MDKATDYGLDKNVSHPNNWYWKTDSKKFGWGLQRKNRRRKKTLNFIQSVRRKITRELPLTDDEIQYGLWIPQLRELINWYINLNNK